MLKWKDLLCEDRIRTSSRKKLNNRIMLQEMSLKQIMIE